VNPIVIVGGGAAGLAAAVFCARRVGGEHVLLLEKQPRVGKKLLATGNGTCNLSNTTAAVSCYHGNNPAFVSSALSRFTPTDTVSFFESLGVKTEVRENGRIYPLCAQAAAVLDCLREEADALGVETRTDTAVKALRPIKGGVNVLTETETLCASAVLVAAGGMASASLGGSTDGYDLLTAIGHRKTPLFPAIVQIRTEKEAIKAVKGIRTEAVLTLKRNGRTEAVSEGEILFADYGVSGPAAMQIGRTAADWERRRQGEMTLSLDLLPTLSYAEVLEDLKRRAARPKRTRETMLTGLVQKRLGQTLIKAAGLAPLSDSTQTLSENELKRLASLLKQWTLSVSGSAGMNAAQVTAGGIDTADVDPETMQSCLVPHVYMAGEVLDIDGECGGFNLQWAWSSAFAAAQAMTEGLV